MNNIELFELSLTHPEPLIDRFYVKDSELIIPKSSTLSNKLVLSNRQLLENITAYKVVMDSNNDQMLNQIVLKIKDLMNLKGMNYSEFASFWSIIDISYSIYDSLSEDDKINFLHLAIKKYIKMRHAMYLEYGYTSVTLQVGKDAKSHKSSGSLGLQKCAYILKENGYNEIQKFTIEEFKKNTNIYMFTDKTGKKLFKEILKEYNIEFSWSKGKSQKMPDLLFKKDNHFYIVEHKHMKEGGGGQDKQISEIIDFIRYSEKSNFINVHYITFLDGLYFNLFTKNFNGNDGKVTNQLYNICQELINNPDNYFVNTEGFNVLLNKVI